MWRSFFLANCFFLFSQVFSLNIIIVMGPSCSGKSTITRNLYFELEPKKWVLLDLDRILYQRQALSQQKKYDYDEAKAIDYLVEEINFHLKQGKNIIVDTNMYDERLIKNIVGNHKIFCVLIYAPLPTLIERDETRNKILSRDDSKKRRAREYVLSSFARFYGSEDEKSYGGGTKITCDLCLNTDKLTIMECVKTIGGLMD